MSRFGTKDRDSRAGPVGGVRTSRNGCDLKVPDAALATLGEGGRALIFIVGLPVTRAGAGSSMAHQGWVLSGKRQGGQPMYWSYESGAYQVVDVDSLAVFYGVQSDGMGLHGQSFDLTSDELDKSLRIGGFHLTDVAETPTGQTPFIGDFRALNGSRQLVGLALVAAAVDEPAKQRGVESGSILARALDGALRGGFLRQVTKSVESRDEGSTDEEAGSPAEREAPNAAPNAAPDEVVGVVYEAPELHIEPMLDDGACPYLRQRGGDLAAAVVTAAGAESAAARNFRCIQAQGMLVMTVARLERFCQGGEYAECRHYRYGQQHGPVVAAGASRT